MREDDVAKIREVIDVAERLSWLRFDPVDGWTMCGAAVEKVLLMALDERELERYARESRNPEMLKLIAQSNEKRQRRYQRSPDRT